MSPAGAGPADQHGIALLGDKAASGELTYERLVDRRALELKVIGDGELVLDRARLLLADLGGEQIVDDALRLMLSFDGGGHDLVVGGLHPIELKLAHEVEEFGSFHQMVLLRLS